MSTPTIEYRTIDKSGWGAGPWQSEPDKRQWQDPETGLPCLIVRGPHGGLCGYVGVSPDHPAHGKGYDSDALPDIEVHGGLTFAHGCGHGDDPAKGICHIPGEGDPDHVWWLGFDCAHEWDLSPAYYARHPGYSRADEVYRDQAYVEQEIASLAKQLAAIRAEGTEAAGSEGEGLEGAREQIARIILGPKSSWNYGSLADHKLQDWLQYPEVARVLTKADTILALLKALAAKDPS